MDEKKLEKTIDSLKEYFEYAEKRLAIHEASHVVFAYLVGHSCQYMQTGLQRDIALRNGSLEIDAQSKSEIYNIFPPFLDRSLQLLALGCQIPNISSNIGVNQNDIKSEIKKHILVLIAGYAAENYFYNGLKYCLVKRIPKKHSIDLTPLDFRHDDTKINSLSRKIGLDNDGILKYKKIVKQVLGNKLIKKTCFDLAGKCLDKTKINQQEIEAILSQTGFSDVRKELSDDIISKL